MGLLNIEIKARCAHPEVIRDLLKSQKADFRGKERQTDTYFRVSSGRLKLREGQQENHLIFYDRENRAGPKKSRVILLNPGHPPTLKEILTRALGVLAVVEKEREIYFIDNVKFHIDTVKDLGTFVEIEASDWGGRVKEEKLWEQCRFFLGLFGLSPEDGVAESYSDLLLFGKGRKRP